MHRGYPAKPQAAVTGPDPHCEAAAEDYFSKGSQSGDPLGHAGVHGDLAEVVGAADGWAPGRVVIEQLAAIDLTDVFQKQAFEDGGRLVGGAGRRRAVHSLAAGQDTGSNSAVCPVGQDFPLSQRMTASAAAAARTSRRSTICAHPARRTTSSGWASSGRSSGPGRAAMCTYAQSLAGSAAAVRISSMNC